MRIFLFFFMLLFNLIACNNSSGNEVNITTSTDSTSKIAELKAAKKITKSEGEKLFLLCAACHNLKKNEPHKVGPNLHNIFGSPAGKKEGYVFTESLKSSGIIWDDETMRKWIENPTQLIKGTSMAFVGIKQKEKQDALIEYIKQMTQ